MAAPDAPHQRSPPMPCMTVPAVPQVSVTRGTIHQIRDIPSPINANSLHKSALCEEKVAINEENGGVKHSTTPDGTPPGSRSPGKHTDVKTEITREITPPNTKYTMPERLVVDGSIYRDGAVEQNQQSNSPIQVVQPKASEDPFTSTPIRHNQVFVNPTAVPLTQISAIIQANLAHPRIASMEAPREDRLNQTVTVHNAQGLFPKEAKLFVANLSNLRTNDQLEISVGIVFNQFGPCTIIIKRDRNHQPMGFVQYQLIQDAEVAMANANNCSIDGRIIRIEWASARQELIISLLTSQPLSQQTVREALAGRGPIASIRPTGPTTLQGESSTAWLVEFLYYADCKETVRLMRENEIYRIVPAPKLQRQAPYPIAAPRTPEGSLYHNNDSSSIFLGSLPDGVNEEELRELFAYLGTIMSCNVISKPMTTGGMNTFAFMEFKYPEDAASAASTTQYLRGQKIRVERKQYSQRRAARVASAAGPIPGAVTMPRSSMHFHQPYNNTNVAMCLPSYHAASPYGAGQQGFTMSDYNTTPPTPVCMMPYGHYASPAPRMRQYQPHQGSYQIPQAMSQMSHSNTNQQNRDAYGQPSTSYGTMNVITEEQEGCIFDQSL